MKKLLIIVPLLMMTAVGLTACGPTALVSTPSQPNLNEPVQLQNEIKTEIDTKLADKKDPNYAKGVTVTSVLCVSSAPHVFDCNIQGSDKSRQVYSYVVAEDGLSFTAKAGQ